MTNYQKMIAQAEADPQSHAQWLFQATDGPFSTIEVKLHEAQDRGGMKYVKASWSVSGNRIPASLAQLVLNGYTIKPVG